MKFKIKPYPKHGDIRYKVFFAWLPITIGLETRWLEKVSIKQIYYDRLSCMNFNPTGWSKWENKEFEKQPYLIGYLGIINYRKCHKCKSQLKYKNDNILTSNPPQREVKCTKCEWEGYVVA